MTEKLFSRDRNAKAVFLNLALRREKEMVRMIRLRRD